ncbi:type IV secretory system conjugative DNA transfer family protein [Marinomonas algicola]|uniref:type IV secretory system conjugative DNA transfer family protein n=1 Tax=Marinomonas algicola TaxID=2773454 RepID=UPI00174C6982|nr:type IV secretory system conjugative DNA transfer family protein [Marinomonas algicola]
MILKPINSNNNLSENHWLIVGSSGSGKTTAVKQLGIVKATDQVVLFDPYLDYDSLCNAEIRRYSSLAKFAKAVFSARAAKQARGFKIAFSPDSGATPESLVGFCKVVWGAGNGTHKKPLKVVMEELAKCLTTSGKANGAFGEILTGGRKFGLEAICIFQRGQEVPKTIVGNCPNKWVGRQQRMNDAVYLSKELDFPVEAIKKLPRYHYLVKTNAHDIGKYDSGKLKKLAA